MRRNPEVRQDAVEPPSGELGNPVQLGEIPPDREKAARRLIGRKPLSRFSNGCLVAIERYDGRAGGEEGFAVPSTPQGAVQHFFSAGKER